jgi:low affinity Fe/Cu permease
VSKLNDKFLSVADWVSEAMGRPGNILGWAVLVVIWTCIFAFGGPRLASGSFLPAWFTSEGFNFPLNLITTVAELFIGFLVAAATNRAQNALTDILNYIKSAIDNDLAATKQLDELEEKVVKLIEENTDLTKQVHELTTGFDGNLKAMETRLNKRLTLKAKEKEK